ncbi:MAG: NUDIX domain-containing protein [Chloroflexota bacterium]|nr:NUDIX domain-containing protein [Chloroflexota bacterium]
MFRIGVFAILFDQQGRVLLCHRRDDDLWNLPGGGLEHGEAPWAGAVREVKEESGLEVTVERLAGVYSKPEVNEVVFSFVCKVTGGRLTLTDEADRIEYFALDGIPPNTSSKQVERIRDAIEAVGAVALKDQRGPSSRTGAGQIGAGRR